jgi:hypothetical protein
MPSSFDPSARYVPRGLRKAATEALEMGWTAKPTHNGWFLRSPKKTQEFYVPNSAKDPDALAKILRSRVTRAYLVEASAFRPNLDGAPDEVEGLMRRVDKAIEGGATLRPGVSPIPMCTVCDEEFTSWDAFASHQGACESAALAPLAAEQDAVVPEEVATAVEPSEGLVVEVPEEASETNETSEPGTIGTKEEAPLETENASKRGGYTWTHVQAETLHRALYEAIIKKGRRKGETDSKWSKRLAEHIESEGLLNNVFVQSDDSDTSILNQIRELLGDNEEVEALKKRVQTLSDTLTTLSELAKGGL